MDVKHHVYKMMRYLQAAKAHKFYNYVHMTAIVCTWRKIWNNVDCWHFRSQTRPKHPNSKKMIHRTAFLVKSHLADSIAESVTYSEFTVWSNRSETVPPTFKNTYWLTFRNRSYSCPTSYQFGKEESTFLCHCLDNNKKLYTTYYCNSVQWSRGPKHWQEDAIFRSLAHMPTCHKSARLACQ